MKWYSDNLVINSLTGITAMKLIKAKKAQYFCTFPVRSAYILQLKQLLHWRYFCNILLIEWIIKRWIKSLLDLLYQLSNIYTVWKSILWMCLSTFSEATKSPSVMKSSRPNLGQLKTWWMPDFRNFDF